MELPPKLKAALEQYEGTKEPLARAIRLTRVDDRLESAVAAQQASVVDLVLEGLVNFAEITAKSTAEANRRSEDDRRAIRRQGNIMIALTIVIGAATAFSAYCMYRQTRDLEQAQVTHPVTP